MIATIGQSQITSDQAIWAVQDFLDDKLGNLVGVGHPTRLVAGLRSAWVVPLVLTSPGFGVIDIVGAVMVDEELGHVVGWTPVDDIRENAAQVTRAKSSEIEAAFQRLLTESDVKQEVK